MGPAFALFEFHNGAGHIFLCAGHKFPNAVMPNKLKPGEQLHQITLAAHLLRTRQPMSFL